jgi:hypothetical protein
MTFQRLSDLWQKSIGNGLSVGVVLFFAWVMKNSFIGEMVFPGIWDVAMGIMKGVLPKHLVPHAAKIIIGGALIPPAYVITFALLTDTLFDNSAAWHKVPLYWTTKWILPSVAFLFACEAGFGLGVALLGSMALSCASSFAASVLLEEERKPTKNNNPSASNTALTTTPIQPAPGLTAHHNPSNPPVLSAYRPTTARPEEQDSLANSAPLLRPRP